MPKSQQMVFQRYYISKFFWTPGGLARSALGSRTLHNSTALLIRSNIFLDPPLVCKGLSIVPAKMLSLSSNGINWIAQSVATKPVATFYYDLPNLLALDAELSLWDTYWKTFTGPCPSNIAKTLKAVNFDGFENIKVILGILGTLPILA